jgi:hypothetical protein
MNTYNINQPNQYKGLFTMTKYLFSMISYAYAKVTHTRFLTIILLALIVLLVTTEYLVLRNNNITLYSSNKDGVIIGFKSEKPTIARYPSLPNLQPTHVRIKQLEPITLITKQNISIVQKYVDNGTIGLLDEFNPVAIGNYVAFSSTEFTTHLGNKTHQWIINPKLQKFVKIEAISKYE